MPCTKFRFTGSTSRSQSKVKSLSLTNCVSSIIKRKNNKGNFIKLHRKLKQNEKMCCAQNLGYHDQGQDHNPRLKVCIYKSWVSHNSKSNKGNFIKLHRKVKQHEKVCCAPYLGSHDEDHGHNPRSKVCHFRIVCP